MDSGGYIKRRLNIPKRYNWVDEHIFLKREVLKCVLNDEMELYTDLPVR